MANTDPHHDYINTAIALGHAVSEYLALLDEGLIDAANHVLEAELRPRNTAREQARQAWHDTMRAGS